MVGIKDAGKSRGDIDFKNFIESSRGFLKIIGLSVPDITEEACRHKMMERLRTDNSFEIQILLVNPKSIVAYKRAQAQTYKSPESFFNRVYYTIAELRDFKAVIDQEDGIDSTHFDVRLYDVIPSSSCMITEDLVHVTPYVITNTGALSTFVVYEDTSSDNSVYDQYLRHFDNIWRNSSSIFLESLEEIGKRVNEGETQIIEEVGKQL
jgi:hypothetical protein